MKVSAVDGYSGFVNIADSDGRVVALLQESVESTVKSGRHTPDYGGRRVL